MSITTVIPTYNSSRYLRRSLDSVFEQSYLPDEVIVVDDGSTDDTQGVVADYASRVTYIWQANAGASAARNRGVAHSTGEWIAFLDADDYWHADKLALQIAAVACEPQAVLAYSAFTVVDSAFREQRVSVCAAEDLLPTLRFRCPFSPSMVLVSRRALCEVGGFDIGVKNVEDWDLWMRLALVHGTDAFVRVPQHLTYYCVVPGSISQQTRDRLHRTVGILDRRLLEGLTGLNRSIWRRKILARMFRDAAVQLREQGDREFFRYILLSLLEWPFPDSAIQSDRYKIAARMAFEEISGFAR